MKLLDNCPSEHGLKGQALSPRDFYRAGKYIQY